MSCRALFFTAPRSVALRELEPTPLDAGAVRVRTLLSAISAGTELLFYRGQLEPGVPVDATLPWAGTLDYPLQYGYAAVGVIRELGSAVDRSWLGRRVFAFQPHAEEFSELPERLVQLPDTLSDERAALLPNLETALSLAMDGAPLFGERVAVLGQGVVGQLLAALLVRSGAEHVALFDTRAERLAASRMLCGAARAEWLAAPAPAQLDSFDLVYELSGEPAALDQAFALARYEGRIVVGSWYGAKRAPIDLGTRAHRNRNTLSFSQVSRIDSRHAARFDHARRLAVALAWLERLPLEALVTHRLPFDRIAEAYRLLDLQSEPCLQVLIRYPSET
ncbi:MAG TPA: zinc-binding alcohol dehydrogenase [Polyangiales bacterium]|nr:zinc-binding alcohol dehydrogenase [Polyangiales bacterium]